MRQRITLPGGIAMRQQGGGGGLPGISRGKIRMVCPYLLPVPPGDREEFTPGFVSTRRATMAASCLTPAISAERRVSMSRLEEADVSRRCPCVGDHGGSGAIGHAGPGGEGIGYTVHHAAPISRRRMAMSAMVVRAAAMPSIQNPPLQSLPEAEGTGVWVNGARSRTLLSKPIMPP